MSFDDDPSLTYQLAIWIYFSWSIFDRRFRRSPSVAVC